MTAGSRKGRLVLIVEPDPGFADSVSAMLEGYRVVVSGSMAEAGEIAAGGRVDLAIIGPSFGDEAGVDATSVLRSVDPDLSMVLVADVFTNRVLRAALRTGMADVIDAPITQRKLAETLRNLALIADVEMPAVDVVFEAALPEHASLEAPPKAPIAAGPTVAPETRDTAQEPESQTVSVGSTTGVTFGEVFGEAPALPPDPDSPQMPIGESIAVQEAVYWPPELLGPLAPARIEPTRMPVEATPPAKSSVGEATTPPIVPPVVEEVAAQAPEPPAAAASPVTPIDAAPMPAGSPPLPGSDQTPVSRPAPPTFAPAMATPEVSSSPLDSVAATGPIGLEALGADTPAPDPTPGRRPGGGKVITVMSGKGGSGKSITATNLAMALAVRSGEDKVVIVDADLQFGDVALLLQIDPTRTIVDVADVIEDLTEPRLDGLLMRHDSGLRVLPAPLVPAAAERVGPKVVVRIMEMLRGMYDFVVVDTPSIFDDSLITILEHSDDVLMVVDMDLSSVKNAKITLDTLRAARFDMNRLDVVVNRSNSKARLDLGELERSLGEQVVASIPSDRLIPQSVNEGIPAIAFSPRSKVAKAFHALARMYLPA
jgi:MinD-like ATPase involved in chromosome partitioning or flagellar assembly/CheY-like chemotaxis protein